MMKYSRMFCVHGGGRMKVIVTVDDSFGMLFNKRRQSQDRILREKILERSKKANYG